MKWMVGSAALTLFCASQALAQQGPTTSAEDDMVCFIAASTAANPKNGMSEEARFSANVSATYYFGRLDGRGVDFDAVRTATLPKLKTMDLQARIKACGSLVAERTAYVRSVVK